jgi:hypothetical protein
MRFVTFVFSSSLPLLWITRQRQKGSLEALREDGHVDFDDTPTGGYQRAARDRVFAT